MNPSHQHKKQHSKIPHQRGVGWMIVPALSVSAVILLLGIVDFLCFNIFIESGDKITLTKLVAGVGAFISLFLFGLRLVQQDRRDIDERFNSAVNLLGSGEESARTGAIYSLYHLAIESNKYRKQVAEVLCAHIRCKTREKKYQKHYAAKPSTEVQTAIDVLFRDTNRMQGLYPKFSIALPAPNLFRAYLAYANFIGAHCQRANFTLANCQGTAFMDSYCQGCTFVWAHCQAASFIKTYLQGANFNRAECQGALFIKARIQGAGFKNTICQGAAFSNAHCQSVNFAGAQCEGAYALPSDTYFTLSERIGKNHELQTMIVSGQLDEEDIAVIEGLEGFVPNTWIEGMRGVIESNKGREIVCNIPKEITPGKLENTPEIRELADKLDELSAEFGR